MREEFIKKFVAYIGHRGPGGSQGLLRVFCSRKCARDGGFPACEEIDKPGDPDDLVDDAVQCFKCGVDLWREEEPSRRA